jgi:hypothetical protein
VRRENWRWDCNEFEDAEPQIISHNVVKNVCTVNEENTDLTHTRSNEKCVDWEIIDKNICLSSNNQDTPKGTDFSVHL